MDYGNSQLGGQKGEFIPNPNAQFEINLPPPDEQKKRQEQDSRSVGISAMETSNQNARQEVQSTPGMAIDVELPPETMAEKSIDAAKQYVDVENKSDAIGPIKTGETLNQGGIKGIEEAIGTLSKTGDVAGFYDRAREMARENLEASYDRKILG